MPSGFNVRHRKVGGIWFLRVGRLQFSFCLCKAYAPRELNARSKRNRAGPRTQRVLDGVKYYRQYEGGSTVVVYRD